MSESPVAPNIQLPAAGNAGGITKIGSGEGRTIGCVHIVALPQFDAANGEVVGTVQARVFVQAAHRVLRVYGAAATAATATGKFDVYAGAASILAAQVTVAAAETVYVATPSSTAGRSGPAMYTARAITTATTAALTGVALYMEIELLS